MANIKRYLCYTPMCLCVCILFITCKKEANAGNKFPLYLNDVTFFNSKDSGYSEYLNMNWAGCPAIQFSSDNKLYVAWFASRNKVEGPGNYIVLVCSNDKGISWQNNKLFVVPVRSEDRFFDPQLFKDGAGNVVLSFSRCTNNQSWDGKGGVWGCKVSYSDSADTIAYSKPFFLFDGVMNNKPEVDVSGSAIIFPTAVWGKGIFAYTSRFTDLESFLPALRSKIAIPSNTYLVEPSITQLTDNSYLALMRNTTGMMYSKSEELSNWTTPLTYKLIGDNANSRHFITKLTSGNLLLVVNASQPPARSKMTAFLSVDGGTSWKYKLLIDIRSDVSYPDGVEDADGNVYLTYDYKRTQDKQINLVKINENDIITGNTKLEVKNINQ